MRRLLMMSGTRKPLLLAPWRTRPLSAFVATAKAAEAGERIVVGAVLAMAGRIFQRQRVRHAVAELHRVGPEVHTGRTGVTRGTDVEVGVGTTVGEEVEERLTATDREARELNERAIPVGQAVVRRTVVARRGARTNEARRRLVPAGADVRPQGAVVGLRARIQRHDGASRPVDRRSCPAGSSRPVPSAPPAPSAWPLEPPCNSVCTRTYPPILRQVSVPGM